MNALKNCSVRRALAMVLTASLAWLIAAPSFAAGEETEETFCETALKKCIAEAILSGLLSWGATIFMFAAFCVVGYDFCVRYIDESI